MLCPTMLRCVALKRYERLAGGLISLAVVQWIERSPGVWEIMGLFPIGAQTFFFIPHS